jgi:hypothetical protein
MFRSQYIQIHCLKKPQESKKDEEKTRTNKSKIFHRIGPVFVIVMAEHKR